MKDSRYAYTIFCDDVRAEIGNKLSLMGCYDSALVVPQFPLTLPKLCFVMTATTPAERPFRELKFRLYRNEDLLNELELDITQLTGRPSINHAPEGTDLTPRVTFRGVIQISPLVLDGPCYFKARILTEEDEPLRGGALRIIPAEQSGSSSPQLSIPID